MQTATGPGAAAGVHIAWVVGLHWLRLYSAKGYCCCTWYEVPGTWYILFLELEPNLGDKYKLPRVSIRGIREFLLTTPVANKAYRAGGQLPRGDRWA